MGASRTGGAGGGGGTGLSGREVEPVFSVCAAAAGRFQRDRVAVQHGFPEWRPMDGRVLSAGNLGKLAVAVKTSLWKCLLFLQGQLRHNQCSKKYYMINESSMHY